MDPSGDIRATSFVELGGVALFAASGGQGEMQPWRSDGTREGTAPFANVGAHVLAGPIVAGGKAFFAAEGPLWGGDVLFESDGTAAGTRPSHLFDAVSSPRFRPSQMGDLAPGRLTAVSRDPSDGCLYQSDGVAPAACVVRFTRHARADHGPLWVANLGERAVVLVSDLHPRQPSGEIWSGAPDSAPERLPIDGGGSLIGVVGGRAVIRTAAALHVTDGTAAGTGLLAANVGRLSSGALVGGSLLFVDELGTSLWRTDGTVAGTERVATIGPPSHSRPVIVSDGRVAFFVAGDPRALWVTDATTAGTRKVADVPETILFGVRDGVLFYAPMDALWRVSLGRSDGTAEGTFTLAGDVDSGVGILSLGTFVTSRDAQGAGERFLRVTDGTPAGTRVIFSSGTRTQGADPRWLTPFAGKLFFSAYYVRALYRTVGGAPAGELLRANVTDLTVSEGRLVYLVNGTSLRARAADGSTTVLGTAPPYHSCRRGTAFAPDRVYLTCSWDTSEVWEVAGGRLRRYPGLPFTAFTELALAGSRAVLAVPDPARPLVALADGAVVPLGDAAAIGAAEALVSVGDAVFFLAAGRTALWRTDGTSAGTRLVRRLDLATPRPGIQDVRELAAVRGRLWFPAADPAHGTELWTSDGTAAGTALVADLVPGPGSSSPFGFTAVGDRVFFWAEAGDGSGPVPWVADADGAGHARPLAPVHPHRPGDGDRDRVHGSPFVPLGTDGPVLFTAVDAATGIEPWISDGTPAGTRLVDDLVPGPVSSAPSELTVLGDDVWFAAYRPDVGRELFAWTRGELLALVGVADDGGSRGGGTGGTGDGGGSGGGSGAGGASRAGPGAGGGGCSSAGAFPGVAAALLAAAALARRVRRGQRARGGGEPGTGAGAPRA